MTISPNGNVNVQCSGGGNPPPANGQAVFTLTGPASISANTPYVSGEFKVTRTDSNGPAGTVAFGYTVGGNGSPGCNFASAGPFWLARGASQNINVNTTASGSCTITLTIQEGHTGTSSQTWTIGGTTPPPPQPPPGCDAPAVNALNRTDAIGALTMSGSGVDQLRMDSGQIGYYKIPAAPNPQQSVLIYLTQGQQPNLPAGFVTEMEVSQCPGVIKTGPAPCYFRSVFANNNAMPIYTAPVPSLGWNDQAAIGERGCFAPVGSGTYYVNVRWTYPTCAWGAGNCGTSMQWAPTGSNF